MSGYHTAAAGGAYHFKKGSLQEGRIGAAIGG
jgi:hypothetical protein